MTTHDVEVRKGPGKPSPVVLTVEGREWHLRPLTAAWLAGRLLFHSLDLHDSVTLGFPAGEAHMILWEKWGRDSGASWNPTFIRSERELGRELERVRAEGIPHRVTLNLAGDPLRLFDPKGE